MNGGPVQYHWQYPAEREQKDLHGKCRNKACIEASIAEAYLHQEVSTWTTKQYHQNIHTKHNPARRYNEEKIDDASELSLFIGVGGKASGSTPKNFSNDEWSTIMMYVLTNMDEVRPYIQ